MSSPRRSSRRNKKLKLYEKRLAEIRQSYQVRMLDTILRRRPLGKSFGMTESYPTRQDKFENIVLRRLRLRRRKIWRIIRRRVGIGRVGIGPSGYYSPYPIPRPSPQPEPTPTQIPDREETKS